MITLLHRQVDWVRAAFGAYPHPKRQVSPIEVQNWEGYRARSFPERQARDVMECYLSRFTALTVCHQNRHKTTYRIDESGDRHFSVFLKYYDCRSLSIYNPRTYVRWLHPGKVFRLFFLMARQEIPTPAVLLCLRDRRSSIRANWLVVTEGIPGSVNLRDWVRSHYTKLNIQEKTAFLIRIGDFVARVHSNGVLHGDLASNTLVIPKEDRIYMIDLDSVRIFGVILNRDRRKQLKKFVNHLPEIQSDGQMAEVLYQSYEKRYQRSSE